MFDKETTGLSCDSDFLQLSAYDGSTEFNIYIQPNRPINKTATTISGIAYSFDKNAVYYNGQEVKSDNLSSSLLKFIDYLKSLYLKLMHSTCICNLQLSSVQSLQAYKAVG